MIDHGENMDDKESVRSDLASLKRLWDLSGPLRNKVVLGILFRFAQSLCLGFAFALVIDVAGDFAKGRAITYQRAWEITGWMAVSLAGQIAFNYLSITRIWLAGFALVGELKLSLLDHLQTLPLGFHLARNKGDTVTALTTDMGTLEAFVTDALARIVQAFGIPAAVLLYLVVRDWEVALAALASILVGVPIYLWSSQRLARLGIRRQDMQAEAAAHMIEYAQGIAVIRAFNRLAKGEEDFKRSLKAFRDISLRMVAELTLPLTGFSAVILLGMPLVMLVAGGRYLSGELDLASLIAVLVLLFSLYTPIAGLTAVMELTRQADGSLTRIDRVLSATPLPKPERPEVPAGFDVQFDRVSFGYDPGRPVLHELSFAVPERTVTAIVGPSGAGKTSILNLLARFWDVRQGAIRLGGVDIRNLDTETLNRLITVVFQDVYLFSGTIFDNIAFGRQGASREEVEAAAQAAQAHEFIGMLPEGYQTRVGEGGATLSGGERQRVSIARAILKNAPIVLLDEATSALDPSNERAIQTALNALVADKTLIVVAHRLSTVRAADQILVLDAGRIVERGQHETLVETNGLYRKLWNHWTQAAGWRIGESRGGSPS